MEQEQARNKENEEEQQKSPKKEEPKEEEPKKEEPKVEQPKVEQPKKVETTIPKEIPKNTEPPKQTLEGSPKKTPTVFVDNRSKLVITDRFEELKEEKTTPKETPKKKY